VRAMDGPILLGVVGSAIITVSAFVSVVLIRPERYNVGRDGTFGGTQPGLKRFLAHRGRAELFALAGASLQLVSIVWAAART
jgi:hypothetical protein